MKVEDADPNPAFICPITNEIFRDPVIAEDGHTYQRIAIIDWLKKKPTSPLTRDEIRVENLKPNLLIRSMIDEFYRFEGQAKILQENNSEFRSKFSKEIENLPEEAAIDKDFDRIKSSLSIQAFICPLTKALFNDPVIAADNHTYEKIAIAEWLTKNDISPQTGEKLSHRNLLPNHATKAIIDLFKKEQKEWKNLKQTEQQFLYIFAPKVQELLIQQVADLEKKAVQKILFNWEEKLAIDKEEALRRQTELNAYKLTDDKYRFQVPKPAKTFVGREKELESIEKKITEKNILCLVGNGGMGKTQLAAEYLYRSKFPSAIWLHGEKKILTFQIQIYLEKAHKIDAKKEKDQSLLLNKFYNSIGENAIVVIDNVEDNSFIHEYLPVKGSPHKVIVTSRYRVWDFPIIELSPFSEDETYKYLRESLYVGTPKISQIEVQSLNRILDGVPLALSQAVTCLNQNPNLTVENYCASFKEEFQLFPFKDSKDEDGLCQVYVTLILALHKVHSVSGQIDLLLQVIGYMAPQEVNKYMVVAFLESQDPKSFTKTKSKKLKQLFRVLCDYSILSQNSQDQNIYSINRLTQSVIRMIHKKNGIFEKNFGKFALWLQTNIFYDERSPQDIARAAQFISHGLAVSSIQGTDFYINKDQLIRQIGYHQFYGMKNYLQAKSCFEQALKISETYHSYDKDTYICILNDLGCVNSALGNHREQLNLLTKALDFSEKFLGKNSEITAQVLTNLGDAYGHLGQYEKQRDTLLRALEIKEKYLCLDKNDIRIGKTLTHLATAYGNLGDHKKKKEILIRSLAISQKYYGKNHPETAVVLMNLGNATKQLGEGQQSIQLLQNALKMVEKRVGIDHPDFALAAMNLGVAYMNMQDYSQAMKFLNLSLKITEKHFGPNSPKFAGVLINLSLVHEHMQETTKAKEYKDRAYVIMFNHYGPNHPETQKNLQSREFKESSEVAIDMMSNFFQGFSENERKKFATDEKLLQKECNKFLEKFCKENENNHEKLAAILNFCLSVNKKESNNRCTVQECDMLVDLGKKYYQMAKYKEAVTTLEQALAMNEKLRGKNDKTMGTILTDLGTSYNQLDQYEKALPFLIRGLEINERCFGENDHMTAISLTNLGATYAGLHDHIKNKSVSNRAYNIFLKKYGHSHQWTQDALFNLKLAEKNLLKLKATNAKQQTTLAKEETEFTNLQWAIMLNQKYGEGFVESHGLKLAMQIDMCQFSVRYDEQKHGLHHPDTLKSLIELGELYGNIDYPDKAIKNLAKALSVSQTLNGKDHTTSKRIVKLLEKYQNKPRKEKELPNSAKCLIM